MGEVRVLLPLMTTGSLSEDVVDGVLSFGAEVRRSLLRAAGSPSDLPSMASSWRRRWGSDVVRKGCHRGMVTCFPVTYLSGRGCVALDNHGLGVGRGGGRKAVAWWFGLVATVREAGVLLILILEVVVALIVEVVAAIILEVVVEPRRIPSSSETGPYLYRDGPLRL